MEDAGCARVPMQSTTLVSLNAWNIRRGVRNYSKLEQTAGWSRDGLV